MDFLAQLPFQQRYIVDDCLRVEWMHRTGVRGKVFVENSIEFLLFDVGTFALTHDHLVLDHLCRGGTKDRLLFRAGEGGVIPE